jgi:hypothetical protein
MRTARRAALPWLALAASLSASAGAETPASSPPSKQACAQAYGDGQHLRADGKLLAAREAFVLCAQQSCPTAARADCAQWLVEVSRALPSIAVHALDASGADLTEVRVSVDGAPVAASLTGQPLDVDPGAHVLRFEHPGSAPVERQLVAVEGEKLRPVDVRFAVAAPVSTEPAQPGAEPARSTSETSSTMLSRHVPLASWVLGGAGLAAFAVAGGLWASAKSDYDGLIATCSPRCNPSLEDGGRTKAIVGDVTAVGGGVALGAAVLSYFLLPARPNATVGSAADGLSIALSPRAVIVAARVAF